MTTNEENRLDLEIKKKKIKLLEQYIKVFDLLPPVQKKKYVPLLPESPEVWEKEFCKDCNQCYACKGSAATNLAWIKILPICLCDRCYKYLMSGRSKELYRILEKKKIRPFETYYVSGISLVHFERVDKNGKETRK